MLLNNFSFYSCSLLLNDLFPKIFSDQTDCFFPVSCWLFNFTLKNCLPFTSFSSAFWPVASSLLSYFLVLTPFLLFPFILLILLLSLTLSNVFESLRRKLLNGQETKVMILFWWFKILREKLFKKLWNTYENLVVPNTYFWRHWVTFFLIPCFTSCFYSHWPATWRSSFEQKQLRIQREENTTE